MTSDAIICGTADDKTQLLASKLRTELAQRGFSQRYFANLCGVGEVQVSRWCNAHARPPQYAFTILSLYGKHGNQRAEELERIIIDMQKRMDALSNVVNDAFR